MGKIKNIFDGYFNLIFKDDEVEEEAMKRATICKTCPDLNKKGIPSCGLCGCPIGAKTRAMDDSCPKGEW